MIVVKTPKFQLGQVVSTPDALAELQKNGQSPWSLIARHAALDFGDLSEEDRQLNLDALFDGSRIFSAYILKDGHTKLWVITEAEDDQGHREATTILTPDSY